MPNSRTLTDLPEVAREFHPSRNGASRPEYIALYSNRKFWWICFQCGHEWEAMVCNRTRGGTACPPCGNKKKGRSRSAPKPGKSLADLHPRIASEWHPSLNGEHTPRNTMPRSGRSIWWRCSQGHEWQATVANRTGGRDCGQCNLTGTSMIELEIYAELRKVLLGSVTGILNGPEAQISLPGQGKVKPDMIFGSIVVEFDGARWHGMPGARARDAAQTARLEAAGYSVIRIREAPLASISTNDVLVPTNPSPYAAAAAALKQLRTLGLLPPAALPAVDRYVQIGVPCASVEARQLIAERRRLDRQSLEELNPSLAADWHPTRNLPLTPSQVTPQSNRRAWWKCPSGHEWEAVIASRTAGTGCPYCSGRRAGYGNDLASLFPSIAAEWHPARNRTLTPTNVPPGSHASAWWRCARGHEWEAVVRNRTRGSGCPYCNSRGAKYGNTLKNSAPALAAEWHPTRNASVTPEDVTPGSDAKAWWQCACGHEWAAVIGNRTRGSGCPACARVRISAARSRPKSGESLADIHPHLITEWHPTLNSSFTPTEVTAGSSKKAWWRCSCGHEWQAVIANRSKGVGCPQCARRVVAASAGRPKAGKSLADLRPDVATEWHPVLNGNLSPTGVASGSNRKVWWQCPGGHEWQAVIANRTRPTSRGCPACSRSRR
ncbi:zinc-ribbon domain-containing protein [Streptomyces sp. NPDC001312]|uniref:zinc-ribbon domain-containing protein n=1 Tax=Streptomyces sp. NPDC001312 TaxID=3364561 RepID=UPI0036BF3A9A